MCKEVYDIIMSPDVDVKEFSKVIIQSIAQIKKHIPRCDEAFAKIEQSVDMLEGNFGTYYKDFIQSQNPSTIIESFVVDVSNSGGKSKTDKRVAFQFKRIVSYYKKATAGKIKDPKLKKVFDMLQSNFDMMDEPEDGAPGPKDGETLVIPEDGPEKQSSSAKRRARTKRQQERKKAGEPVSEGQPATPAAPTGSEKAVVFKTTLVVPEPSDTVDSDTESTQT